MAKFVKAPVPAEAEAAEPAAFAWLADYGIATGPVGAGLLAAGALLLLLGLWRLWGALHVRLIERHFDGEVAEVEPARGGGYHPVILFTDGKGQKRRFTAAFTTRTDPTGRQVLVREGRARPEVVPPGPAPWAEAMGLLTPFALGAACIAAGLTGSVLGLMPLPMP